MADIPTLADLEGDLVLAQRVELLVSSASPGTTADDKFTAMRHLELEIVHPETRFNHGTMRSYGHGTPDIGVRFTLSVTHDIINYLRTRGLRSALSGTLPVFKYAMKLTSNDNTTKTITVNGKLTEKKYIKNDAEQGSPVDAECLIRVVDESEPTAI